MFKRENTILLLFLFLFVIIKLHLAKKHEIVITPEKKQITVTADPGDTIEYQCPYNWLNEIIDGTEEDDEYINADEFCFEYVVVNKRRFELREFVQGSYNIVKKNENDLYKGQFTIPPIVLSHKTFQCYCYVESNNKVVKSLLRVNIKRSRANIMPGCDFNFEYKNSGAITTFKRSKYENFKVCSIYPKNGDYIGLLCPRDYTIKPDGCFNNVYLIKNKVDDKNEVNENSENWDEKKYEVAKINTILKNAIESFGDDRYTYAKFSDVNESVSFICTCQSSSKANNLIMNVYLNQEETKPSNINEIHKRVANNSTVHNESKSTEIVNDTKNTETKKPSYSCIEFLSCSLIFFLCNFFFLTS